MANLSCFALITALVVLSFTIQASQGNVGKTRKPDERVLDT